MAKAYLGKISALVTANTSDFNSKLNASAQQVGNFARAMQTQLTRAETSATASLRGIYTESQKVSRALQAAASQRLQFKGYDTSTFASLTKAISQFKSLQAAAVAVNEPLSRAARAVEKLSAPVQLGFDPALKSAQKSAEYLSAALARGGVVGERSFERIERRALAAAQAADRLAEAAQMASAGPRGTELAFAAPRVRDSLAASADVRQRAAAAPASVLEGGRVANDVQKLVAIDNLIQKRRAEIESGTILNIDTTRAQASLESLLQIAARVRAQVSAAIGGGGADAETASMINRARAQRDYYEESERLANQAASDAAAPLIARARAERDFYEESRRLASQAAADAAAPLIARAQAEREFYEESERLRRQAAADSAATADREVAPLINRARAERDSQLDFGLDLDAPKRQIEVLRGSIVSLKGQLDTLPAGIRAQFVPAILAAQQNLEALSAAPAATTAELTRAAREVDRITQALGRARQAANIPSFRQFARDLSTRQAVGELQALQQLLARIGAQAGGPAAQAYNRYAAAVRRAAREGTTELPATRRELERLQVAAAQAAAATNRISFRRALGEIRRGGDVARGGFDNLSLAVNQAAFAIDDFFSSTGGLEFKLRAVSNNITQLAFILGGTQGLFIGLAAVIGGQVAVAINKWINDGRTAEDQTKALNDALARQKSLVEDLAQAFQTLGDSLTRKAFSPAAQEANAFRKEIDEVIKKQKELRDARAADIDPNVQRERATQGALQRRLDSETNIGRRVAIQAEIEASRRREQAAGRAASERTVDREDVRQALERALSSVAIAQLPPARDPISAAARVRESERIRRESADQARRRSAGGVADQRAAVQSEIDRLAPIAANGDALGFGTSDAAAKAIARLQEVLVALEGPFRQATDDLVISVLRGSKDVADALESAQKFISDVSAGPSRIASEADAVAKKLEEVVAQLQTAADPAQAEALGKQRDALLQQATALNAAAESVKAFSDAVNRIAADLVKTVLGETESMASQARRADNAAEAGWNAELFRIPGSAPDDGRERRDRAITRGMQATDARDRAEAELRRQRGAAAQFEVARARGIQDFERQAAGGGLGREAADLVRQRDEQAAVLKNENATIEQQQEAANKLKIINERLAAVFEGSDIGRALAQLADKFDIAAQQFVQREQQIRDVQASAERGRELFVSPEQRRRREIAGQLQDAENAVLEGLMSEVRAFAEGEAQNAAVADAMEDGVLSLEEISDIFAAFPDLKERLQDDVDSAMSDLETMRTNLMENSIQAQMARSVENAVLQGPSRAALTASDVTTTQGAQELNRLLRGDDAGREADFVEMQKQTTQLEQVNEGIKQLAQKLGVAQ